MKESMNNTQSSTAPPAPQQAPQHYFQPPPPAIFQNPIPHQGVMNTQHEIILSPPQIGKYQNTGPNQLGNSTDCNILLTSEEDILLQTHGCQYGVPP
jgi:hypothetical protein